MHGTSVYTYKAAAGGRLQMRPYLRKICFCFWWEQDQGILLSINIYPTFKKQKKRKILLKRLQNKIKREESQKSWEERRESTVLELQFIQLVQSGPFHSLWSEPGLRVVLAHVGNTSLKTTHPRFLCLLLHSTSRGSCILVLFFSCHWALKDSLSDLALRAGRSNSLMCVMDLRVTMNGCATFYCGSPTCSSGSFLVDDSQRTWNKTQLLLVL